MRRTTNTRYFKRLQAWHVLLPIGLALAAVLLLVRRTDESSEPTLTPLDERPLELPHGVDVHAAVGATSARPVLIVLSDPTRCNEWSVRLDGAAHVVCGSSLGVGAPGQDEGVSGSRALRVALTQLKQAYSEYVAPSPVVLVGEGKWMSAAKRLALQEPEVFSTLVLWGAVDSPELDATFVEAFARRGGTALVLLGSEPLPAILVRAGRRAGLAIDERQLPGEGIPVALIRDLAKYEPRLAPGKPAPSPQ